MALKPPLQFLILLVASWLSRRQAKAIEYLRAENRVLRAHLGAKRLLFTDAERRLLAEKGKPLGRALLAEIASLATPETILRWYRQQIAAKYDGTAARRGPGRRRSPSDTVEHVVAMARDNPSWGYTRLRGALENVGLTLGRSTIQRILKAHGIEPAPTRGKTMPWTTFLKAELVKNAFGSGNREIAKRTRPPLVPSTNRQLKFTNPPSGSDRTKEQRFDPADLFVKFRGPLAISPMNAGSERRRSSGSLPSTTTSVRGSLPAF
jgi:transposase